MTFYVKNGQQQRRITVSKLIRKIGPNWSEIDVRTFFGPVSRSKCSTLPFHVTPWNSMSSTLLPPEFLFEAMFSNDSLSISVYNFRTFKFLKSTLRCYVLNSCNFVATWNYGKFLMKSTQLDEVIKCLKHHREKIWHARTHFRRWFQSHDFKWNMMIMKCNLVSGF